MESASPVLSGKPFLSSIPTLFSDSWRLFARHAATTTVIMTVLLLFTFWPFYYLKSSGITIIALFKNPGSLANVISFMLPFVLVFIFFFVFFAWSQVALVYVFSRDKNKLGAVESIKMSLPKIIPYALTLFCIFGALAGGLVLLVIPGLAWTVYFIGGAYTVVTENLCGPAALSRNKTYVAGHWKAVGARLLLLLVIWFVVNFATAMILQTTGLIKNLILEQLVFCLINFLLLVPFFQAYGFVLHRNLVSLAERN